jgi:prevent-host-death family protein
MKHVTYGVRELQANLGDALRAAQRGDQVIITSRGKAVAVLAKANASLPGESAVERKLRRLASEGKVRLGTNEPIPPFKPYKGTGLSGQVIRDRR